MRWIPTRLFLIRLGLIVSVVWLFTHLSLASIAVVLIFVLAELGYTPPQARAK